MYNVTNHYWLVEPDQHRVYSSLVADFVSDTDANYLEWLTKGGMPTKIADIDELRDVLKVQFPSGLKKTVEDLNSFVDAELSRRWRSGFPIIIDGVTKWFHSDEFSLAQHLGLKDNARDLLAAGGAVTDNITIDGQPVVWSTMDGSQVSITIQVAFNLVTAAGKRQVLIFAASEAHRVAIASSQDPASYDALSGWPSMFGDPA